MSKNGWALKNCRICKRSVSIYIFELFWFGTSFSLTRYDTVTIKSKITLRIENPIFDFVNIPPHFLYKFELFIIMDKTFVDIFTF